MVPAGTPQELRDTEIVRIAVVRCRIVRVLGEAGLECFPAFVPVLTRKRMLNVAQARIRRRVWIREPQAFHRSRIVAADLFQPALRFFAEIVERAHETPSFRCACVRLRSGRKKVRIVRRPSWVGFPCRGQEAPQRALRGR